MMKVLEHDHPLKLIDLPVKEEDVEESDEEEEEHNDVVAQYLFGPDCERCYSPIIKYHKYYYECVDDSCEYSLHRFCAELPTTLKDTSHPHLLTLTRILYEWTCFHCQSKHSCDVVGYACSNSLCYFHLDITCAVEGNKKMIHHPSHPHPLLFLASNVILCECSACGKKHEGIFFLCATCPNFAIHIHCAFLPERLLIQQTTNGIFHHTHPLTLSYSFPEAEQKAKYKPKCRVCHGGFFLSEDLWIYKCEKCIYYACVDCATSRKEPFMSILSRVQTVKNFKDDDYPNLFHLPFPDLTYSIPRQLFFKETRPETYDKVSLHHHELILVHTKCIDGASSSSVTNSLVMCHNPMKKIELLCNGCVRPIMEMPFYRCGDKSCNFALHEWCTQLPTKVYNHPCHPQHTLFLVSHGPDEFNIFDCDVCGLHCNGYAYCCAECRYYVDVTCGFIPEIITHKSHPGHLLSIVKDNNSNCIMCLQYFYTKLGYSCRMCDVYIHLQCALLLPETIRHAYDRHPMKLSYLPIENHKSEYFCEICENKLNPHSCFYHCDECAQSVHSACAPLILCCETETYSYYGTNVYWFSNFKFGIIYKIHGHPHPLSIAQGTESDGTCSECWKELWYMVIFKCFECEFAAHVYCCWELNRRRRR